MTVQELFNTIGFPAIAEALRHTHRNDKSTECLTGYKEAFDILCNIPFNGCGGAVTFDVTPRERLDDEESLPLLANNVEGDYWENIVGKAVVRPDNNPFTDAELAGAILWGRRFTALHRTTAGIRLKSFIQNMARWRSGLRGDCICLICAASAQSRNYAITRFRRISPWLSQRRNGTTSISDRGIRMVPSANASTGSKSA